MASASEQLKKEPEMAGADEVLVVVVTHEGVRERARD